MEPSARTPASSVTEPGALARGSSRRAPWIVGFFGALGAACAWGVAVAIAAVTPVLVLIALSVFLAIGLDPVMRALVRRGLGRGLAASIVLLALISVLALFSALAMPSISREFRNLHHLLPTLLGHVQARSDSLGTLAQRIQLNGKDPTASLLNVRFLLSAGEALFSTAASAVAVLALTGYLLAGLPDLKAGALRLIPRSRRSRMGLLFDEILRRTGGFLLGNIITSLAAGISLYVFLTVVGVPDAAFLGLLVALFDLIPVIGAIVAGAVATLFALTVSLPVAMATAVFVLVFRLVEDYALTPRIMKRTVDVPPLLTVIAVLIGGSLLGIVGGLLAVPVAAALDLVRTEVLLPRQDSG